MREWAALLFAAALPPAIVGFGEFAGKSNGIARTLAAFLLAMALTCLALSFRRRRS